MRITVELIQARRTEVVEIPASGSGADLLKRLGLAPDAHLLLRGDIPIPIDERLEDGERIGILSAISGGSDPTT